METGWGIVGRYDRLPAGHPGLFAGKTRIAIKQDVDGRDKPGHVE
jgi:hypothetical protein